MKIQGRCEMLKLIFALVTASLGLCTAAAAQTTTYSYDVHGRVIVAEDTSHADIYYDYDDANNLTYVGVDTPPPNTNAQPSCNNFTVTIPPTQNDVHTFPIPQCSDPDGDPLILTQVTPASGATVSIDTNERIYFSGISYELTVTTFTVSDGNGGVASALSIVNRPGSGGGFPPN